MSYKNQTGKTFKYIAKQRRAYRLLQDKKMDVKIINEILTTASYCPSSFGLEPWKVLIISNKQLKEKLLPYCNNQLQAINNSHLIIILSCKKEMFDENNPWIINQIMATRNYNTKSQFKEFYVNKFLPFMVKIENWDEWSIRQSYILLDSILLAATANKVDSCPMEGINGNGIINFLIKNNIINFSETETFTCPYVIALGYKEKNNKTSRQKVKLKKEKFVFIN